MDENVRTGGAENLLKAAAGAPPLTVRVNSLRTDAGQLAERLREEGFSAVPRLDGTALEVEGTGILSCRAAEEGLFSVQDISSMIMIRALDPKPGETVLDVCAAPGGKSLAAAERMENRGRVISCDIYDHKLALIRKTAERLGISIIETHRNDATKLREEYVGIADRVIADVPCSGLGVIRRKPELKLRITQKEIDNLSEIQYRILENASHCLKKDGTLVYSTCTVSEAENGVSFAVFSKKTEIFF